MRLLVTSAYFDTHLGGVEVVAGELARELAAAGETVEWAATNSSPTPTHHSLVLTPLPSSNFIERRIGFPLPLLTPKGVAKLYDCCRRVDAVLIHDTLGFTSIWAFVGAKVHRRPILVLQHLGNAKFGNPLLRAAKWLGERFFTRPMLSAADQVVFISEATAAYFKSTRLRRPAQISFSGINASFFFPVANSTEKNNLRRKLDVPENGLVVLYVGRFVEAKGLEILRQVALLRSDLHFCLAGWGTIDPETWQLPNVKVYREMTGHRLGDLYRSSDLFLLASHSESFSLVVREALASGLPVICNDDLIATDSQLGNHVTGVRINPAKPIETANDIAATIDPAIKSARSADGVSFIRRRYDRRAIAAQIDALIRTITLQGASAAAQPQPPAMPLL